jgi:hypothetical protein
MSVLDQIMGRQAVIESDVVPAVAGARTRPASMLRRQEPKDKEEKKLRDKAREASVVASIIGMAESDQESIIPADAKRLDPYSMHDIPGMSQAPQNFNSDSPSEPSTSNAHGEELIPPVAALVAPDVTPKVFEPIDPSKVPAPPKPEATPGVPVAGPVASPAPGALDTILGRQNYGPQNGNQATPVTVESFMQAVNPIDIKSHVAEKLVPASAGGSGMPLHQQGDGKTIFNAMRNLMG